MAPSHQSVITRTIVLVTGVAVQVTSRMPDTNKAVTHLEVAMTTNSQVLLLITNKDKTGTKVTQSQGPGGEVRLTQS